RPTASRVPQGLFRTPVDVLPEPVPHLRRTEARVHGRCLRRTRWVVLGSAIVAEDAAELRREAATRSGRLGAPPLPLVGGDRNPRGLERLGLRRPLPPPLRAAVVRRQAGVRLLGEPGWLAAGRLRPQHLRRHVRLALRPRLAAGERLPRSPADGCLLLRLLPLHVARTRQRRDVPPDDDRAPRHTRR